MGFGLDKFTGAGRALGTAGTAASGAVGTDTVTFVDVTLNGWKDLPQASRDADDGAGQVLAEDVDVPTTFAQKLEGVPHQVATAWRAYVDRIVVVRCARELKPRAGGGQVPAGPWRHVDAVVHRTAPPLRTRGAVPAGPTAAPGTGATHGPALPHAQRLAAQVLQVLPAPVRASATAPVPTPTLWLGGVYQSARQGRATGNTLQMLRMDDRRAVVVVATRTVAWANVPGEAAAAAAYLATRPWDVTQLVYDLTSSAPAVGGTSRSQIGRS